MAGVVRLSVFNEVGNLKESDGLAYLGMPVFWSVFILAAYALLDLVLPQGLSNSLLALGLIAYAVAMLWHGRFFKFKQLNHIVTLTVGGAVLFAVLQGVLA